MVSATIKKAHELMARLALEDSNPTGALEQADKALAISPKALDAMAIHASVDWLADKTDTPWIGRILEANPKYGQAYATAGHFFVLNRRYEEGIKYYRKAIEMDPRLWAARAQLGVNLMRLGEEIEAKQQLELCYESLRARGRAKGPRGLCEPAAAAHRGRGRHATGDRRERHGHTADAVSKSVRHLDADRRSDPGGLAESHSQDAGPVVEAVGGPGRTRTGEWDLSSCSSASGRWVMSSWPRQRQPA